MTEIVELTIAETLEALKKKEVSAVELVEDYKKRITLINPACNAYVAVTADIALEQAKASDERYAKGEAKALDGIPLGIKDIFCTKGIHSQSCSNILKGFKPEYESTVTQKLLEAGASFLGKLNMDEMAMGSSNETSCYGPVLNPWGKGVNLVAGGSSGGSVAAVAANMCAGATGTDTGGSIRQPAAFCGVVGIKPTYGRCSRYGIMPFASSLDQAGPITKDVKDSAIMLNVMSGYDPKDSTSANLEVPDFTKFLNQDIRGLRIGIPKEYRLDGMNKEIEQAWVNGIDMLEKRGAEVVEISLPHTKYALAAYYIIAPAEASSNLARYDGVRYGLRVNGDGLDEMYVNTRTEGFGDEVKRRIMIGTYVLSAGYYDAYYVKAQKVRRLIREDFIKAFEKVDAILTPTAPSTAFEIGDKTMLDDPINMYLNDVFTVSLNMAGLPGMSVPVGLAANGLPLGLQIIGKAFDEATIFKVASALEQDAGFKRL